MHSNRPSGTTAWLQNFAHRHVWLYLRGLSGITFTVPFLEKSWLPTPYSLSCIKGGCHAADGGTVHTGRFSGPDSYAALRGSAHRRRLFPGAAWMVCRDKWVEGLCWVHLGYLQALSGTQCCFIQPFLSNLAWLITKELTTFRCWEEGTEGGQHHHPDFKRSISPQTKANLPQQSAAQES